MQYSEELYHYGVKGMKWGVRRYRNSDGSLTNSGKKRYLKEMQKDQKSYFKSRISKEAAKVTSIGRNGQESRGQAWNKAYRQGKVTNKDDSQIRKAAKETREYMKTKYGESAVKELAKSGTLGYKIKDFEIKQSGIINKGRTSAKKLLETVSRSQREQAVIKEALDRQRENNI